MATPLLDPLPNILKCGSLNLLAGASGIGKTALLSWMLRQFETGAPIFGHAVHPPPAIGYFSADRPWDNNSHWFTTSGVETLQRLSLIDDPIPLPNQRMKHLRVAFFKECVQRMQLPPGSLLIVDPIALFLGGNLLDYDTVAFACIEIQRWLQRPECQYCVIGVCHSSKQKADKGDRYLRLQDRISGSMAQLGYTDTQMFLAAPEETGDKKDRYTFLWNSHSAPCETFQFRKGPNGLFLTDGANSTTLDHIEGTTDAPLGAFELEVLAQFPPDAPVATLQILALYAADGGAGTRKRLFRTLKELERRGLITQVRRGLWRRTSSDT